MNNLEDRIQHVIRYFGDKDVTFLGDVLEKIRGRENWREVGDELLVYWKPCGFTKSLQEIFGGIIDRHVSEHRPCCNSIENDGLCSCNKPFKIGEYFRDNNVQNLLDFLYSLTQEG